jgi:hypothetical protein
MAQQIQRTPARQRKAVESEKTYYIVNPAGALHEVSYEHARARLRQIGYRTATAEEIAELKRRGGNQRFDDPIAEPFNPQPEPQVELE